MRSRLALGDRQWAVNRINLRSFTTASADSPATCVAAGPHPVATSRRAAHAQQTTLPSQDPPDELRLSKAGPWLAIMPSMAESSPQPPTIAPKVTRVLSALRASAGAEEPKTLCERCGAEMYRIHAVWRCPQCRFKTDCCGW